MDKVSGVTERYGALSQSRGLGPLFFSKSRIIKKRLYLKKFYKISWGPPRNLILLGALSYALKGAQRALRHWIRCYCLISKINVSFHGSTKSQKTRSGADLEGKFPGFQKLATSRALPPGPAGGLRVPLDFLH